MADPAEAAPHRATVHLARASPRPQRTLNDLWGAVDQHGLVPDRIVLLAADPDALEVRELAGALRELVARLAGSRPTVDVEPVDLEDADAVVARVGTLVRGYREAGHRVVVDARVLPTLPERELRQAALEWAPDHLLHRDAPPDPDEVPPYPHLPPAHRRSRDLVQGSRGEGG